MFCVIQLLLSLLAQSAQSTPDALDKLIALLDIRDASLSERTISFRVSARDRANPDWKTSYEGVEYVARDKHRLDVSWPETQTAQSELWDGGSFTRTLTIASRKPEVQRSATKQFFADGAMPGRFGVSCLGAPLPMLLHQPHEVVGRAAIDGVDCLQVIIFKKSADSERVQVPGYRLWLDDRETLLLRRAEILFHSPPDKAKSSMAFQYNGRTMDVLTVYTLQEHILLGNVAFPSKFTMSSPMVDSVGRETETVVLAEGSQLGVADNVFATPSAAGPIQNLDTRELANNRMSAEALPGSAIQDLYRTLVGATGQAGQESSQSQLVATQYYDINCAALAIALFHLVSGGNLDSQRLLAIAAQMESHAQSPNDLVKALNRLDYAGIGVQPVEGRQILDISKPCIGLFEREGFRHFALIYPHEHDLLVASRGSGVTHLTPENLRADFAGHLIIIGPGLGKRTFAFTWPVGVAVVLGCVALLWGVSAKRKRVR